MADGNGNQAVLEFLNTAASLDTLSAKQRNEFTAQGVKLMVQMQITRDTEWKEYKGYIEDLRKYSIGFWMYRKPKTAFATTFLIVSFLISDIRQPVFQWLGGILEILLKFKLI